MSGFLQSGQILYPVEYENSLASSEHLKTNTKIHRILFSCAVPVHWNESDGNIPRTGTKLVSILMACAILYANLGKFPSSLVRCNSVASRPLKKQGIIGSFPVPFVDFWIGNV